MSASQRLHTKTPEFILLLYEGHESETSTSNRIYAIYLSPTVESLGHLGLCIDATFVGVGQTEPFLFKMTGITVSTFYGQGSPSDTILRFYR